VTEPCLKSDGKVTFYTPTKILPSIPMAAASYTHEDSDRNIPARFLDADHIFDGITNPVIHIGRMYMSTGFDDLTLLIDVYVKKYNTTMMVTNHVGKNLEDLITEADAIVGFITKHFEERKCDGECKAAIETLTHKVDMIVSRCYILIEWENSFLNTAVFMFLLLVDLGVFTEDICETFMRCGPRVLHDRRSYVANLVKARESCIIKMKEVALEKLAASTKDKTILARIREEIKHMNLPLKNSILLDKQRLTMMTRTLEKYDSFRGKLKKMVIRRYREMLEKFERVGVEPNKREAGRQPWTKGHTYVKIPSKNRTLYLDAEGLERLIKETEERDASDFLKCFDIMSYLMDDGDCFPLRIPGRFGPIMGDCHFVMKSWLEASSAVNVDPSIPKSMWTQTDIQRVDEALLQWLYNTTDMITEGKLREMDEKKIGAIINVGPTGIVDKPSDLAMLLIKTYRSRLYPYMSASVWIMENIVRDRDLTKVGLDVILDEALIKTSRMVSDIRDLLTAYRGPKDGEEFLVLVARLQVIYILYTETLGKCMQLYRPMATELHSYAEYDIREKAYDMNQTLCRCISSLFTAKCMGKGIPSAEINDEIIYGMYYSAEDIAKYREEWRAAGKAFSDLSTASDNKYCEMMVKRYDKCVDRIRESLLELKKTPMKTLEWQAALERVIAGVDTMSNYKRTKVAWEYDVKRRKEKRMIKMCESCCTYTARNYLGEEKEPESHRPGDMTVSAAAAPNDFVPWRLSDAAFRNIPSSDDIFPSLVDRFHAIDEDNYREELPALIDIEKVERKSSTRVGSTIGSVPDEIDLSPIEPDEIDLEILSEEKDPFTIALLMYSQHKELDMVQMDANIELMKRDSTRWYENTSDEDRRLVYELAR
jgi:hypothetical protein